MEYGHLLRMVHTCSSRFGGHAHADSGRFGSKPGNGMATAPAGLRIPIFKFRRMQYLPPVQRVSEKDRQC
jgi:hypothetical protein